MIPYQMIYWVIGLCLLIFAPFTESKKVHELMTEDEILKVFHTTPDKVPDYEIVPLEHSLYKRSTPQDFRLKFKAFDKDVDIYLNPNEGILVGEETPVWISEYFRGSMKYRQLKQGIMKAVLGVYQSVPGRAALVVRTRNERDLQFDGTVEDLSVIPLPSRLHQEIEKIDKKKRDLYRTSRSMMITEYHIVFKTNTGDSKNNTAQENNEDSSNQSDIIRLKRGYDVVFPTILVTTDFNVAVKSNDDNEFYDQIIYQLAFWNAVDLKYRHLSNPRVRLRIAGFIIGYGRSGTPYLKRNMVNDEVDIYSALQDMEVYWSQMRHNGEFSAGGFNIVTTATNLKLFAKRNGKKNMVTGVTEFSSICIEANRDRFYPSAIFRDDLAFGGINTAVHELGHILGTNHDDLEINECPSSAGYLMAPKLSSTVNNPKWSKCSLELMKRTLSAYSICIEKPKEHYPSGKPLGKILPGTLKTTHEQCQARGFDWACKTTPGVCRILRCYYTGFYGFFATLLMCQNSWSAAEGTECAPGRVCIDGECKSLYP